MLLERQVGLGHACAAAVPTPLDVKRLLNVFSLVSAGGFLILKCSVTTASARWWWGVEILLANWMWQKILLPKQEEGVEQFGAVIRVF